MPKSLCTNIINRRVPKRNFNSNNSTFSSLVNCENYIIIYNSEEQKQITVQFAES